jgi:hypothetical protein
MSIEIPSEVKALRPKVTKELETIRPSVTEYGLNLFPCQATLEDGSVHSRVYLVEASTYIREWGVWPWDDRGKTWLPAEQIVSVVSSPLRLPAEFANSIYSEGESGMGYFAFSVDFAVGPRRYYATGNAVDFPTWWVGVDPANIVGVNPHDRDPDHQRCPPTASAEYAWSPFRRD